MHHQLWMRAVATGNLNRTDPKHPLYWSLIKTHIVDIDYLNPIGRHSAHPLDE